jgi:hypothetical protein
MLEQIPMAELSAEDRERISRSDPAKGLFGGNREARGRALRARVIATARDICEVTLEVVSMDPTHNPLTGVISFFLHPTFPKPLLRTPVIDGRAIQKLIAWGAFTVGVLADDGETALELDLADPDVPGPDWFKAR